MWRVITMYLSLIAVITVNIAANSLPLNGKKTVEIMNSLPVLSLPASYVIFIWSVIYIFLSIWIFGFYYNRRQQPNIALLNTRTFLFITSAILNIAWFFLWHFEFFDVALLSVIVLLAVLIALYFTYPKNENKLLERIPVSLYLGWIIVAFIANTDYVLTMHEWDGWGISTSLWTVIILTLTTTIALHFMYHYRDVVLNIVFMWVFIVIAVISGFDSLFVTSASLFLTAVIGISFLLMKKPESYA